VDDGIPAHAVCTPKTNVRASRFLLRRPRRRLQGDQGPGTRERDTSGIIDSTARARATIGGGDARSVAVMRDGARIAHTGYRHHRGGRLATRWDDDEEEDEDEAARDEWKYFSFLRTRRRRRRVVVVGVVGAPDRSARDPSRGRRFDTIRFDSIRFDSQIFVEWGD